MTAALARVIDPELRRPITELGMVAGVSADDDTVLIGLKLTIVGCPAADRIERDVRQAAVDAGALDGAGGCVGHDARGA